MGKLNSKINKEKDFGRKSFFYYALMAFGVYAAASVSYEIGGSVKFEVTGQFVQIDYTLKSKIGGTAQSDDSRVAYSYQKEGENLVSKDGEVYKGNETTGTKAESNKDSFGLKTFTKVGDYAEYTIKLTNKGAKNVDAKITLTGVQSSIDGLTITKTGSKDSIENTSLTAGGSIEYVLKIELADMLHDVDLSAIKFTVDARDAASSV